MKLLALAAVLLLETGCASTIRNLIGQRPNETAPLTKVRENGDGVCAYVDATGNSSGGNDHIMACARHDAAGDRAVLFTGLLCRTTDPRFDPTTWNVVVTRQDGGMGRRGSVDALNTAWAPGRYAIHYTNSLDGKAYDLSITLQ